VQTSQILSISFCTWLSPCTEILSNSRRIIFGFCKAGALIKFRKRIWNSYCMFFCPPGTTLLPLEGFSWNFIFEYFSKICRENWSLLRTKIMDTLYEDQHIFLITSRSVLHKMRNVSVNGYKENHNTFYFQ
jgi:hypothetical protein